MCEFAFGPFQMRLTVHDAVKSLRRSINPDYLSADHRCTFDTPSYPGDSSIMTGNSDKNIPASTHYIIPKNILIKDSADYDHHINPANHYIFLDHSVIYECLLSMIPMLCLLGITPKTLHHFNLPSDDLTSEATVRPSQPQTLQPSCHPRSTSIPTRVQHTWIIYKHTPFLLPHHHR